MRHFSPRRKGALVWSSIRLTVIYRYVLNTFIFTHCMHYFYNGGPGGEDDTYLYIG